MPKTESKTITPTRTPTLGVQSVSDENLMEMQDAFLNKNKATDDQIQKEDEEITEETTEVTPAPTKEKTTPANRAERIFKKTQEAKIEDSKEEEHEEDDAEKPGENFIDLAEIDPEDKKEEKEKPVEIDIDKENNLKNLRQVANTFKQERNTLQAKLQELEELVAKQPESKAVETKLMQLQERVKQLEPYEMIFALHDNPIFQEKFIKPVETIANEIKTIVEDYGIDTALVDEILTAGNRKELDDVLSENFASMAPQLEIKTLLQKYQGIQKERQEFEKQPQRSLEMLRNKQTEAEAEKTQKRNLHFKTINTSGWVKAINLNASLDDKDKIYELIEVPGKKDHNEKVVKPTLGAAKTLFEQGMNYLESVIKNGVVPNENFAVWFANLCQQASATAMLNQTRTNIYKRYKELKTEQDKSSSFDRPGINGGRPGKSQDKKAKDGRERAANIFEEVLAESQKQ